MREVAGLLLVAVGVAIALFALGAIHPLISTHAAVVAVVAFNVWSPPKTRLARTLAGALAAATGWGALTTAFLSYAPLGWFEVGAAVVAAGVWLASEGA
ncbi:hypothetical protein QR97_02070 [Streptomyces sp. PBH53]|uniref:hypothetical protein n=1 Tax=Streptomyces sp. PBH53 TaxID=1577075 RepID=UPI000655D4AE|nr:hypothetical protein [Streptomyces sp. PBH53]AKN68748.1 hypothetical protein QR97_02070 [Streptomyces sp. PBH53]